MELNRLEIYRARQDYKRNNAIQKLAGRKPATEAELILAELRLVKHLDPEVTIFADSITNASESLKYYRKRYNNEGVTKIFERFTKAKPFTNARKIINVLGVDAIKKVMCSIK